MEFEDKEEVSELLTALRDQMPDVKIDDLF